MSEYNIQMNKYNASKAGYDQLYPQPMKHANTHAKNGSDPITPANIGAYSKTETDTLLQKKADLGADGKVLESQIPSLGFKPQIVVTAPTGSTVTCTKGTTVLTAEEVNETWTFDVSDYGEWIVSDGSKSVTVNVDVVKQYTVDFLQQVHYKMLYDAGDRCVGITGGWEVNTSATWAGYPYGAGNITIGETDIQMSSPSNQAAGATTVNMIPVSGYSMMWCRLTASNQWNATIALTSSKTYDVNNGTNIIKSTTNSVANQYQLRDKDISDVNQDCYVNIGAVQCNATFTHVFFTMADDWGTLCSKAGISTPSTLNALITDSSSMAAILASKNAMQYMIRNCTGDFMASAVTSSTFLTALNSSPYKEMVYANEHWSKFLAMVA